MVLFSDRGAALLAKLCEFAEKNVSRCGAAKERFSRKPRSRVLRKILEERRHVNDNPHDIYVIRVNTALN